MSDSDDDLPISALKRPASAPKSSKPDSSDDEMPIQQLAKKHAKSPSSSKGPVEADSDDDLSLADLKKKSAEKAKAKPATKAKATPAKSKAAKTVTKKGSKKATPSAKKGGTNSAAKKTPSPKGKPAAANKKTPAKKKPAPKKKAGRSKEQDQSSGEKLVTRSGVLSETKKGELVQKLLCRWWYAMEWPAKEDVIKAPPSYEALEGYPGVYLCVEGDEIGKLLDNRNKDTCPCYTNFSNKTSEELKTLLEVALTKQKEALIKHWGAGLAEESNIDKELKWLKSVEPGKADRTAARILSKAKINN